MRRLWLSGRSDIPSAGRTGRSRRTQSLLYCSSVAPDRIHDRRNLLEQNDGTNFAACAAQREEAKTLQVELC